MNTQKKNDHEIYKWISIICLFIIPIADGIGIVFDINRDPKQILYMALSFLILSWVNWSKYKKRY